MTNAVLTSLPDVRLGRLASMPVGRLQILAEDLALLSGAYDKVILDMGAGVEKSIRILSGMSGRVIVVCTDEPTALTDAYAFVQTDGHAVPEMPVGDRGQPGGHSARRPSDL